MKNTRWIFWLLAAAMAAGCASTTNRAEVEGIYQGIIPSADGPGMELTVYLYPENECFIKRVYLKVPEQAFYNTGRWRLENGHRLRLTFLRNDSPYLFRIDPDRLTLLDAQGEPIQADLPNLFLFRAAEGRR